LLNIDAPSAAIKELERTMSINEDILRFLTVRVDALEEGPSAVMQRSSEKSDRPGGDRPDRGGWSDRPPRRERPRFGDDVPVAAIPGEEE
jgi:small subunit ribosomal protein S6